MAQRINADFVQLFNQKFTEEISRKYQTEHFENCHHWDFNFLPWHRQFVNRFWEEIQLPHTYAILTEQNDRLLYASLEKTLIRNQNGGLDFVHDSNKLNSFSPDDLAQIKLEIAEAMATNSFALDLNFEGTSRDFGAYNISFSSQIEEFHDIIHGETGQGMRSVLTAGGDQCFFIHHTFVDLVFETWLNDNPDIPIPITEEHFNSTPDLQDDYESYEALTELFNQRHYSEADYKAVRRISAPLSRQVISFESIKHTEDFRRVIMFHRDHGEIGRFAVLTGRIETCLACARKESHKGTFLLRQLVPVSEIMWNINNQWFDWENAKIKFQEIGMSIPVVISF